MSALPEYVQQELPLSRVVAAHELEPGMRVNVEGWWFTVVDVDPGERTWLDGRPTLVHVELLDDDGDTSYMGLWNDPDGLEVTDPE